MGKRKLLGGSNPVSAAKRGGLKDETYHLYLPGLQSVRSLVVDRRLSEIGQEKIYQELAGLGVKVSRRALERFTSREEMPEQFASADEVLVQHGAGLAAYEDSIRSVFKESGDCMEVQKMLRGRHKVVCASCHILSYLRSLDDHGDFVVGGGEEAGPSLGDVSEATAESLMREHGDFIRSRVEEDMSVRAIVRLLSVEMRVKYSHRQVWEAVRRVRQELLVSQQGCRQRRAKVGNWDVHQVMREHGEFVRHCRLQEKRGHRTLRHALLERGVHVSDHTCKVLVRLVDEQIAQSGPVLSIPEEAAGADLASDGRRCRYLDLEDLLVEFSQVLSDMVSAGLETAGMSST